MPNIDTNTGVWLQVNLFPLMDNEDFKSRMLNVVFSQAGMELVWVFTNSAGEITQTQVTPTDSGDYEWSKIDDELSTAMYQIYIPASEGASINNDTAGYGQFIGKATGILSWISPIYRFREDKLNDVFTDGGGKLDVNVLELAGSSQNVTDLLALFGKVNILQALSGKNQKLVDTDYDDDGNLISGTLYGYASKADLEANGGDGQNPIFVITLTGEYAGVGRATSFIQTGAT